ncbi:MAG: hypothetical protein RRY33_08425 [Alistipes sp.]
MAERRKWWLNPHQTWSATGYLRLFLLDVFGINFSTEGIALHPVGLSGCEQLELKEIPYRKALLNLTIKGHGAKISRCTINGQKVAKAFVPATASGRIDIDVELKQ